MGLSKKILRFSSLDSTSDEARRQITGGAEHGTVILAETQTKGRGKPGSSWFSPKGNLYLSLILKLRKKSRNIAPVTLLTALSIHSVLSEFTDIPIIIKWPNDLLVKGKKIGGILTEQVTGNWLIIGIGMNVNCTERDFPPTIREQATSLRIEKQKRFDLGLLVERITASVIRCCSDFILNYT